jgi:glycosyltransferase involved in cell wall biosynthesis
MRIVHVIASLDPAQGGPPVVAGQLAAAQTAAGHAVTLAAEVVPEGLPVPAARLPTHGPAALWAAPSPDVRRLVDAADVVHLHGVWEPILPAVARAARAAGRPYLVAPHGMLDPWSLRQKRWKKRLALTLGYRRMLNAAAALHVLNADERELMRPLGLTAPCEVIPNGIFLDQFAAPGSLERLRERRAGLGDRPYVLFLSRLHYKKGLDILAEAFGRVAARIADVDLVVAGPDGGAEAAFREQVRRLGLTDRVWVAGPLYGDDKRAILGHAVVFCLPSRQEGFSVAILEALACRVPVVITKDCHFPEVAEVAAGRVVSLDAGEVADAIIGLLSDAELRDASGAAGRALVESRFTWPKVAEQTIAVYERIVQQGRGVLN